MNFYPPLPGRRMAWDRDGSTGVKIESGVITPFTEGERQIMNNESSDSVRISNNSGKLAILFPEPRNLVGYFVIGFTLSTGRTMGAQSLEVSTDTTNGEDGTWTTIQNPYLAVQHGEDSIKPAYRDKVTAITDPEALGIIAVRFSQSSSWHNNFTGVHLYGDIPGDRLRLWDPVLDEELDPTALDWGDTSNSSSGELTFRIKNGTSDTANNVDVALEALTPGNPSIVTQHALSDDGITFVPSLTINSIAAGQTSAVLTLRRDLDGAALGLASLRIVTSAGSFS